MMDALEKRVRDRMGLEARQLRAEQMKLGKRRTALAKDATKAQTATGKLFEVLAKGDVPSKTVTDAGTKALKTLSACARQMFRVNADMGEHADGLARLEEHAEFERRLAVAKELGVSDEPMTGADAAEVVLIRRGKATHITDLTSDVLESGIVKLTGKTPAQTMSAYLAKEIKRPDGRFVRVAPGVFDLRDRTPVKA